MPIKPSRSIDHGLSKNALLENNYTMQQYRLYLKTNGVKGIYKRGTTKNRLIQMYLDHQKTRAETASRSAGRVALRKMAMGEVDPKTGKRPIPAKELKITPQESAGTPDMVYGAPSPRKNLAKALDSLNLNESDMLEENPVVNVAQAVETRYFNDIAKNTQNEQVKEIATELSKNTDKAVETLKKDMEEAIGRPIATETKLEDLKVENEFVVNTTNNDRVPIIRQDDQRLMDDLFAEIDSGRQTASPVESFGEGNVFNAITEAMFRATTNATQLARNIATQAIWTFSNQQIYDEFRVPLVEYLSKRYGVSKEFVDRGFDTAQ